MNPKIYRKFAIALFIIAPLFLAWVALGVGVLGADGDPGDLMYFSVFAIAIYGAYVYKWKAEGMIKTLIGMTISQLLVTVLAFFAGYHKAAISSWQELLFFNLFFVVLYGVSAFCFYKSQSSMILKSVPNGI